MMPLWGRGIPTSRVLRVLWCVGHSVYLCVTVYRMCPLHVVWNEKVKSFPGGCQILSKKKGWIVFYEYVAGSAAMPLILHQASYMATGLALFDAFSRIL